MPVRGHSWDYWDAKLTSQGYDKESRGNIIGKWEKEDANLQQLPYELLIVNVSTIGIHFLTGILLTLGFLISAWI